MSETSSGEYQCEHGALVSRAIGRRLAALVRTGELPEGFPLKLLAPGSIRFCPRCGLPVHAVSPGGLACPGCSIDIEPLLHELLELNPHVPSAPPPDVIQISIELHDSDLKFISSTSLLLDAYVHRWVRHGLDWSGSGWVQPMRFAFLSDVAFPSVAVPVTLSGGRLIVDGATHDNCVPYPVPEGNHAQLILESPNNPALELSSDRVQVRACGDARFVEALPHEFAPIDVAG